MRLRKRTWGKQAWKQLPQPVRDMGKGYWRRGSKICFGNKRPEADFRIVDRCCKKELERYESASGPENPYQLRKELWETMDSYVYVYRTVAGLEIAKKKLMELRKRYQDIYVKDKGKVFNSNLRDAIEIGNMIELAQTVVEGALARRESRGSHAMEEFPKRDDANFLKHTLAFRTDDYPRIAYSPVKITKWQPMERVY